jgi:hypothetical protein
VQVAAGQLHGGLSNMDRLLDQWRSWNWQIYLSPIKRKIKETDIDHEK